MGEHRFPKTVRDVLRCWGFAEDGSRAVLLPAVFLPPDAPASSFLTVPVISFVVRSPDDAWWRISDDAALSLRNGVRVICVVDPVDEVVVINREDQLPERLEGEDELTFPNLLPGFSVNVSEFFA